MITKDNFNEKAEEVIRELRQLKDFRGKNIKIFSTSQIRKILSLIITVDNKIDYSKETLTETNLYDIQKIYVKLVYQAGRESAVNNLINKANFFSIIKNIQKNKKSSDFKLLIDYMEALVAWRKLLGGRDQ